MTSRDNPMTPQRIIDHNQVASLRAEWLVQVPSDDVYGWFIVTKDHTTIHGKSLRRPVGQIYSTRRTITPLEFFSLAEVASPIMFGRGLVPCRFLLASLPFLWHPVLAASMGENVDMEELLEGMRPEELRQLHGKLDQNGDGKASWE